MTGRIRAEQTARAKAGEGDPQVSAVRPGGLAPRADGSPVEPAIRCHQHAATATSES
ncbi:hypothetical protein [Mycolicibacterium mageritense]|uniref:Uncharacterized protein n=1 Tax=Mycolicibacterium mageritense TaxID=53462 RepID=A0AAI8XLB6_MYCME|nr:hypothetical protein [Mycolicibacterium mageritense]BDY26622.1 hypothetical protein hbim_00536 [Mycolicibacterium mageritense]